MGNPLFGLRVKLVIPEEFIGRPPKYYGEYYGYCGHKGTILSPAGKDGVWVKFDSQQDINGYVGCPIKYIELIDDKKN